MNDYESEVLIVAKYLTILHSIFEKHSCISLTKLIVFCFLAKKDTFNQKSLYDNKTKNNIVAKYLTNLTGNVDQFFYEVEYILEAIHILILNNYIELSDKIIKCVVKNEVKLNEDDLPFFDNVIFAANEMSDEEFLREVLRYV